MADERIKVEAEILLQLNRNTAEGWAANDLVLGEGEPALLLDTESKTPIGIKYGDGKTKWSELTFYLFKTNLGEDGISPTVEITETENGHKVSITDVNGRQEFNVLNGQNGIDGKDGEDGNYVYIKGVTISSEDDGQNKVTFSDGKTLTVKNGSKGSQGIQGPQGEKGADGRDGQNGADGISTTHSWNGTTLTITSASGTSSADLKGEKGDKGDRGEQGIQGIQGERGLQGEKGDTGARGANGKDGYTPVKGTDYWTNSDKEEIVQEVITALGIPVFGRVDENKVITFTGELSGGTYTFNYEDKDGNVATIGTYSKEAEPTWTNLIPLSINPDGTPYIGLNGEKGYKAGYRIKSDYSEVENAGTFITGYIPVTAGDILYFSDIDLNGSIEDGNITVTNYKSDFTVIERLRIDKIYLQKDKTEVLSNHITFDEDGRLATLSAVGLGYWLGTTANQIAYMRFTASSITDKSIITKNEPIS